MRVLLSAVVALAIVCGALGGKWPLRAPHREDVPATFDCAMRKLAYQFGKQLLPRYGNFESLYYALGLNGECQSDDDTPIHFTEEDHNPKPPTFPVDAHGTGAVLFVDYANGADSNDGSQAKPFKTISKAVATAEGMSPGVTINLRAGTHYVLDTVQFSAKASSVTIQNYNGEIATVSGGMVISPQWKPYNTTPTPPPPAPAGWTTQDNFNYVDGCTIDNKTFVLLGKPSNKDDCQALCKAYSGCHAYTWHDKNQEGYALDCIGRTDGYYLETAQSGHYSGRDPTAKPASGPSPSPSPTPPTNPPNMYVADLSSAGLTEMPGLQFSGIRATRARFPNGGLETVVPDNRISGGSANWQAPDLSKQGTQTYIEVDDPALWRNFTSYGFQKYMVGINGPCDIYDPPVSYWCSKDPSGGGAFAFRAPQGLWTSKTVLPNSPYKDLSQAIVNVWRPSRWANWMFEVKDYDASTNNITFGRGGFQGARGNNEGGDFFIENIFEEFDYQNEFFYDVNTKQLYFFYNGTGAIPATTEFVVPTTRVLFNLTSPQTNPIRGVTFQGLTLTATRYTYMDPHGVPSGGDWALDRTAAVFLQGTEQVTIDSCNFTRLDGNAVMVSGYNRNATITNSEFSWIGGNAMAGWGFTNESSTAGIFGTDGDHPRYTTIMYNLAREVGLYEKQSSFWFQGKVAQSIIKHNVFFNGPRAGINFNDGFGGGDELGYNLMFSTCRNSGDHGPFNSWDRQPFITDVRTGQPSIQMQWRELHHNFLVDNYSPQEAVDNDDGSGYYHTHDNFLVYGGQGMKNDFGGHDNYHYNNIYGYVGQGLGICSMIDGHEDGFYNNTLVMTGNNVGSFTCSGPGQTIVHDNHIYTSDGTASECGHSPPQSPGTTVAKYPADAELIGWAAAKLGIKQ